MNDATRDTIYEELAAYFGINRKGLTLPGTSPRTPRAMTEPGTIVLTRVGDHSILSACTADIERISRIVDYDRRGITTADIVAALPEYSVDDTYPHAVFTGPVVPEIAPPDPYVIAPHDPNGSMVAGFIESCDEDDLDAADVDPDEPDLHVALAAVDGIAVGYAGFRIWERNLADVGVLVAREHRRCGLASALVASVTATAVARHLVPLYWHESAHTASAAVRARVGYEVFWEATVLKLRVKRPLGRPMPLASL